MTYLQDRPIVEDAVQNDNLKAFEHIAGFNRTAAQSGKGIEFLRKIYRFTMCDKAVELRKAYQSRL